MTPTELAKSNTEHAHQRALFAWANQAEKFGLWYASRFEAYSNPQWIEEQKPLNIRFAIPQLKWMHAIHNQGHGDAVRGGKARAEGVKAGVADIFLPCPKWHMGLLVNMGLYIEMKRFGGKASTVQNEFITDMRNAGYACKVCEGWEAARDTVIAHLGLTVPPDAA